NLPGRTEGQRPRRSGGRKRAGVRPPEHAAVRHVNLVSAAVAVDVDQNLRQVGVAVLGPELEAAGHLLGESGEAGDGDAVIEMGLAAAVGLAREGGAALIGDEPRTWRGAGAGHGHAAAERVECHGWIGRTVADLVKITELMLVELGAVRAVLGDCLK